ncbi:co-chaperone protein DjlA [Kushneria pakistanensis]|uniref:Co-chaperone protein DjlA n=1 Tax=Kushneria pakistanensis TaxID=1508770 RepID=A0ABQ3FHK8_9GAMM|nr:co-chaperone DjlA [Kushneria pakistanensis]GHC24433.1 co-chaperone protein DjlA [Kushneria pakistanensis]
MLIVTLIAAFIGYLIARLPGLLIGGLLGYALVRWLRAKLIGKLAERQTRFLSATFSVMGAMSMANGEVSDRQRQSAEAVFDRLNLNGAQRDKARADFERGQQESFDLEAELAGLRQIVGAQRGLLQVFFQVQLVALAADGQVDQAERDMLVRVARGLGCSQEELSRIEAMLNAAASGGGTQESAQPLEEAYRVLGVSSEATDAELKRAYRRLMSQNHPDKLAGKGMPDSMKRMAEQRTSEISNAYERIRQARGQG